MIEDTEYQHMVAVENALEKTNILLARIIQLLEEQKDLKTNLLEVRHDPSPNTW